MDSPLETELSAALTTHNTPDCAIRYSDRITGSEYRFRTHRHVLCANSVTLERKFDSGEYKVGSIITIPPGNVQAVEDMLRFFYLLTYNPRLLPSAPMSMMQAQKRQAAHHVAVYDLARQKSYGVGGLSGRAHRAFQNGADGALAWLDQPANNTAKNAVRLLRMYVNLIYENDDESWEVFQGQDMPDMITFWPLRGLVCETAARIWVRAQQWNATPAVGQAAVQGEEEVEIDAEDTGEDVVKKELAKLCWKNEHFAQDFARWMLIKGEVTITLGHNVMGRTW